MSDDLKVAITQGGIGFLIEINFGAPFIAYDFPREGEAMATATDYRKWAEECFGWARAASYDSVREQYASLGRFWLERAAQAERLSGRQIDRPEPNPAQKVA